VTSTTDVFHSETKTKVLTPAERLHHVISFTNNYIADTHYAANMFSTVFVGIFSVKDGTLTYVNCGNEPPFIIRKGHALTSLPPTGPVMGLFAEAKFSVKETLFEKNDLLLAFTDGIPDARNSEDDSFGHQRLRDLLSNDVVNPDTLLKNIEEQLIHFIGKTSQFDDITLLAVRRNL
jgi:sigma-B regulation protein RsbU (phosphoserine phosphatase)